MKIAAYTFNGQPGVGLVSKDLQTVQAFDLPEAQRALGALPIVEMLSNGAALPKLLDAIALNDIHITAPLPKPRRNIFLRW